MQIGGLQKLSLIDYPGVPAAVVFTQGCNMACPYCHNPQLVYPHLFETSISDEEVFSFLKKRQKLFKGVVITGGEPTLQKDLAEFIVEIKKLNFFVKLDTNGANPKVLKDLIDKNLLDFIAMDIKSPADKYNLFFKGDLDMIKQSLKIIQSSGVAHLFRTTYDADILNDIDLSVIKKATAASTHIVQECRKQSI
ncbi:MAG: anaerobic ribonucleoside-triphosphate reductase activating protein [Endomicrobium sp.]|jgi:pyruvate formate lyase activating enzyme|nr:anaerobic ribonucleoside-triphosphate reductase activating protein [Endomicrobium sp.]